MGREVRRVSANWQHPKNDKDEFIPMNRGAVASATRGRRGQAMLRDLLAALDAMPIKELVAGELQCNGGVCALGSLGVARDINMKDVDAYDRDTVASLFGIAAPLAAEIMFTNDDWHGETPEHRWSRMRNWVAAQIKTERA